ncbi:MAG: hypothetical protein IJJ03_02345 [Mogibacterium sp.]|nr:hypothetical protein [Mogibacterium sp.]MBQ6501003.1 hypothetical protein [Mogibacterium sp.]
MTGKNRKMNSEINVVEILWRFCEQWKAVLLFSLAFALIFTSVKYVKDTKDYKKDQELTIEVQDPADVSGSIAAVLDGLNEADRKAVERQIKEKELLDAKEDYYDNSLVFHIDPGNCGQIQLQYKIDTDAEEDKDRNALVEAYENSLMSDEAATMIAEAVDPELDMKYIYELFATLANETGSAADADADATLVVRMLVPAGADTEVLSGVLNDAVLSQEKKMTDAFGRHDIKLISDELIVLPDIELAQKQTEFMAKLIDARTNYAKNYALLTDQQRAAYNAVSALSIGEEAMQSAAEAAERPKPRMSAKAEVAGFILGAFIYGAIMGLIILIRRRAISEADTGYYPGVRSLYGFVNNDEKKGLFHSAIVEKIRRRNLPGLDEQTEECAETLSLVCEREKLNNVTILSPGELEKDCDKLITEVCSKLKASGINVSKKELANAGLEIGERELAEAAPVIPVVVEDVTSLDGFNKLMNTCANYKVDVIGTIYYGTR